MKKQTEEITEKRNNFVQNLETFVNGPAFHKFAQQYENSLRVLFEYYSNRKLQDINNPEGIHNLSLTEFSMLLSNNGIIPQLINTNEAALIYKEEMKPLYLFILPRLDNDFN